MHYTADVENGFQTGIEEVGMLFTAKEKHLQLESRVTMFISVSPYVHNYHQRVSVNAVAVTSATGVPFAIPSANVVSPLCGCTYTILYT